MSRFKLHSFVVSASLFLLPNVSYSQTHKGISFQGVIKLPSGEYPTKSGLTVNSYILSSNNCILREEQFTGVNVANGYINIPIGTGLVTGDDPGLTMKQVMDNSSPITQGPTKTSGLVCLDKDGNVNPSVTSFNPTTGDGRRKFRLNVVIDGTPVIADFNMRSMAYAINAESSDDAKKLNGKTDTSFIQTSTNITQTAVESWFSSLALLPIINGTYNAPTATTATNLVGGIDGLLPAQSGNTGKFLKTNGSSVSWADIPAAATGLTQLGIDLPTSVFTNGADITANGKVSAIFNTQNAKTFFAGPTAGTAVPSFRTLTTGDVSGFNTDVANIADTQISGKRNAANGIAGLDAASKIPIPLLPNDAIFADSVKTGTFKITGPASSEIQLSAPTTSVTSYNLVLPDAGSTAGKVLKIGSVTGSTMNLIWGTDVEGVGTLTSVGLVLPTDIFQVGSPLTANGDLTASLKSQTQKYVLAAPNAADGAPVFRQLLVSDISNAGTASLYNVPVTGNAGMTEVVKGDDSRLGNPREPIDGSVTTAKIADGAVTDAKIAGIAANKISGQIPSGSLPVASDTTVGIVNIIAQTFKGAKTFVDALVAQGTLTVTGLLTANGGVSTTSVTAASLQVSGGSPASGKILTSDASGNASWQAPASSGTKAYQSISTPYSIIAGDAGKLLEVTNGSAVTLPNAATVGAGFFVSIKRTGTSDVTINTTSAQTIDGQSSQTLQTQYSGLVLVSNGTNWIIESKYGLNPALLVLSPTLLSGLNATIPSNGACQSITVNNTGQIASSSITVTVPANFTKAGCTDTCHGNTLAGGASCTVGVAASGSAAAGAISGNLSVAATTGGTVQAALSGTVTDPCPSNFILVPALSGYTTSNFCVAKYEMRNNGSNVAISQSSGTPWVSIPRGTDATTAGGAWKACKDMGANYDLISNAQWQTIARNIEGVASNWSGGSVGSGSLNRGHSDGTPNNALAAAADSDPCNGTGETCSTSTWNTQRRTHTLSNGAVIWDLAGNVWEWVKDNNAINFGANAYVSQITTASHTTSGTVTPSGAAKVVFGPAGDYSAMNSGEYGGLGYGYVGYSAGAVFRGGNWVNGAGSGVFTSNLGNAPTASNSDVGFRCVYQP